MKISNLMNNLKEKKQNAFIPYITAGDPDLKATLEYIKALVKAGADIIELGVPFSDPVADGPVNQRASERALKNNISLLNIIEFVGELRKQDIFIPIVLFTYLNPLMKMGFEKFADLASENKVSGVLIVDFPPELAGDYKKIMDEKEIETIFLASPTTDNKRLELINDMSSGFVYYVSRAGVTGVQNNISETLAVEISKLKEKITKPVAVGFGISTPEQALHISEFAEGIVVGSAIVKLIEEGNNLQEGTEKVYTFSKSIKDVLK